MKALPEVVSESTSDHSSATKSAVLLVGCTVSDRDAIAELLPGTRLIDAAPDNALELMRSHAPVLAIVALGRASRRAKDLAGIEILSLLVQERQVTLVAALCRADDREHTAGAVAVGAADVLGTDPSGTALRHLLDHAAVFLDSSVIDLGH